MSFKKFISILLLVSIVFCVAAPAFASQTSERNDDSLDTFLSVLNTWGTFLSRITGNYEFFDSMALFSNFAHKWREFVDSDGLNLEKLMAVLLEWLGVDIFFDGAEEPQTGPNADGSYTL
ncbi:MAG: hypothetical protein Q4F74_00415 [Synergistaceae bacterium]|nr:hypothetical protein [Synergistaceae bacterium]